AHEELDEPGPVPALERQLLVMNDDRGHRRMTASAARWPAMTALSMVAGRPVSIQSPARTNPLTPVSVFGRAGWPGASEKGARGQRTTVARTGAALRREGRAQKIPSPADPISSSFERCTIASAPLDTSDRCDADSPDGLNTVRLSNTHCIVRPGRPTNGSP